VVLQGISPEAVHPLVLGLAERDRITVLCTEMDVQTIISSLRGKLW
jgi:putative transcriptional regulator